LSKVYKSSRVTIDKEHIVTIDVEQVIPEPLPKLLQDVADEFTPIELGGELYEEEEEEPPEIQAQQIIEKAQFEADGIIAVAQREADDILDKARTVAASEREAASKEGRDKGYAEGLADTEQMKNEANEIVSKAYAEKEEILQQAEPRVVKLIGELTKKLLLDEAEINPDVITILVKSGLSQTTLGGSIKVRVSNEDYENVVAKKSEIMASFEGIQGLELFEDLALPIGGCIIETDFGSVDASMNKQCDELIKNLNYLFKNR